MVRARSDESLEWQTREQNLAEDWEKRSKREQVWRKGEQKLKVG